MNRKVAAALFIAGATLANMLLTGVAFLALLALWGAFLAPRLGATASVVAIFAAFVLAAVADTLVYRAALGALRKRVDFEKAFGIRIDGKRR